MQDDYTQDTDADALRPVKNLTRNDIKEAGDIVSDMACAQAHLRDGEVCLGAMVAQLQELDEILHSVEEDLDVLKIIFLCRTGRQWPLDCYTIGR